jgi:hypothetical protein
MTALGRATTSADWRLVAATTREVWIRHALRREAEAKILTNAEAFARGTYWPTTAAERLALIAVAEDRGLSLSTARLFAEAFAEDPRLRRGVATECRYRAAVAAARSGCGQAPDGSALGSEERDRWRAQSLAWLRDELAALREGASKTGQAERLSKWRTDRDLRAVRDPALLARLPEAERAAFTAFWGEVDATIRASR